VHDAYGDLAPIGYQKTHGNLLAQSQGKENGTGGPRRLKRRAIGSMASAQGVADAMTDRLLLGLGRHLIPIPRMLWRRMIEANGRKARASLEFMSQDHHRVRDFVVTELPRVGAPLTPETIAATLMLPVPRVTTLLDDLERHLTFLFRNDQGAVTWAYPVTVETTPHRARFRTGEEAYSP
jgi:hypothetical protein